MTASERDTLAWNLLFACWLIALVATLGSLFFSEVMERTPCVLCWYQRIAMFPLVLIFTVGLFPLDTRCTRYAWPIALAGALVALYHCLLYLGVLPEGMQTCTQGVSCADVKIEIYGFLTIPLLSLGSFLLILALLFGVHKVQTK